MLGGSVENQAVEQYVLIEDRSRRMKRPVEATGTGRTAVSRQGTPVQGLRRSRLEATAVMAISPVKASVLGSGTRLTSMKVP